MDILKDMYRPSLALLTDLYQLTMAYGYWKTGRAQDEGAFNLFFRRCPFKGGYAVAAGLEYAIDYLADFAFDERDIAYLRGLEGNDGRPLFDAGFLNYLSELRNCLKVDAVPEGTAVFPHAPIIRVRGPLPLCQLVETPLLNIINFQTLIATKAARICDAAGGDPVLEFGLRRAQGIDGSVSASRAAYIGGCVGTSNVLAGRLLGIPVKGTHAHSWVMTFEDELSSFQAYARAMPNNCVFLVDTYDTLAGVRHAIEAGKRLREQGYEMVGIRLDSGDLAYLSIEARKLLDEAGFPDAAIVASNDLDENIMASLKQQGATIAVWGVGTKLVTGFDQPALGGVYKLSALRRPGETWQYKMKLSEQTVKSSIPGILQVRRYSRNGSAVADMIYDEQIGVSDSAVIVDPGDPERRRTIEDDLSFEDLLIPVFDDGRLVAPRVPLTDIRKRTVEQIAALHTGIRRLVNPHSYPCGLESQLHEFRIDMIREIRKSL